MQKKRCPKIDHFLKTKQKEKRVLYFLHQFYKAKTVCTKNIKKVEKGFQGKTILSLQKQNVKSVKVDVGEILHSQQTNNSNKDLK